MQLGSKHVETPFIELGQIVTIIYFIYFFVVIFTAGLLENSLVDLKTFINKKSISKNI
jgi:ubiquinol-cytochrome c reductase cytochrome b subunit